MAKYTVEELKQYIRDNGLEDRVLVAISGNRRGFRCAVSRNFETKFEDGASYVRMNEESFDGWGWIFAGEGDSWYTRLSEILEQDRENAYFVISNVPSDSQLLSLNAGILDSPDVEKDVITDVLFGLFIDALGVDTIGKLKKLMEEAENGQ